MNKDLLDLIKIYCTKEHIDFSNEIINKSKENIISLFTDLLTMYINDFNSSTLREIITVEIAGFEHMKDKIGYNGYRQLSASGKTQYCEIKPINSYTRFDGSLSKKFMGQGNFTDFSWKKLARITSDEIKMVLSGFLDGKLLYVLSFDFNEPIFLNKLSNQLQSKFPEGDKTGFWLRSANFNYLDYKDASSLKIIYLEKNIKQYAYAFSKNFLNLLINW